MPVIRAFSTSTSIRGNGRLKWLSVPAMTPVVSSVALDGGRRVGHQVAPFRRAPVVVPRRVVERRVQDRQRQVRPLRVGQQEPRAGVVGDPRPRDLVDPPVEVARGTGSTRRRSGRARPTGSPRTDGRSWGSRRPCRGSAGRIRGSSARSSIQGVPSHRRGLSLQGWRRMATRSSSRSSNSRSASTSATTTSTVAPDLAQGRARPRPSGRGRSGCRRR